MTESQVIVVYNSAAAEATALKDAYLAAHPGIGAAQVLDLSSKVLVDNPADLTYADFKQEVRDPVRAFLAGGVGFSPQSIVCIVLIRPMPHRIQDSDQPTAGDFPSPSANNFNSGDATFASVDAELVLLWQDLDNGEAGGTMDSHTDNTIDNPYHTRTEGIVGCADCDRSNITTAKTFTPRLNLVWELGGIGATLLTPGDMYLVCRIDGTTLADAEAVIDRAQDVRLNQATTICVLDEFDVDGGADDLDDDQLFLLNDPFIAGNDFEEATAALEGAGWTVRYDGTTDFIEGFEETRPIAAYASYGENHSQNGQNPQGSGIYIEGFLFPRGAMFNTAESYNGRALNGLETLLGQEQIADFITAGGTFGVGYVWEPFTITLFDNEFLFVNFLVNDLTFAEAAYSAMPALSWQHVVVGDPLAKASIVNDPGLPPGDLNGDGFANGLDLPWFIDLLRNGPANYHAAFPALDPIARADFNGDQSVSLDDLDAFVAALLEG
jgi:hypothetical protein